MKFLRKKQIYCVKWSLPFMWVFDESLLFFKFLLVFLLAHVMIDFWRNLRWRFSWDLIRSLINEFELSLLVLNARFWVRYWLAVWVCHWVCRLTIEFLSVIAILIDLVLLESIQNNEQRLYLRNSDSFNNPSISNE